MLAILDCVQTPRKKRWLFRLSSGKNRLTVHKKRILGAPVMHIVLKTEQDITPRALKRRLGEARRILSCGDKVKVCFTRDFPYDGYFYDNGFTGPDLTGLYEAVAAQAAQKLLCEGGSAYFSAIRFSRAGTEAFNALCGQCRHILADVAYGGADCFDEVQRRLGISVVENPAPEQLLGVKAAVFMGAVRPTVVLSDDCVVFAVSEAALAGVRFKKLVTGLDLRLPEDKEYDIADGFPRQAIVANAINNMTLALGEVELKSLKVSRTDVFRLDKARFV